MERYQQSFVHILAIYDNGSLGKHSWTCWTIYVFINFQPLLTQLRVTLEFQIRGYKESPQETISAVLVFRGGKCIQAYRILGM